MDEFGGKDYPSYGQLEDIIILKNSKFFIVQVLETSFHSHFMCYEVVPTNERVVVLLQNLPWHGLLNIVRKHDNLCIVEKDTASVEDM